MHTLSLHPNERPGHLFLPIFYVVVDVSEFDVTACVELLDHLASLEVIDKDLGGISLIFEHELPFIVMEQKVHGCH